MKRKICVFTGARADYGVLKPLLYQIKKDKDLHLQLIVSGMHLSPEFGDTYHEIERDGFKIDEKVEILLSSDTSVGMGKAMGLGLISFPEVFYRLKPDILVLLGDRFEAYVCATAASISRIPIAHLCGGESTYGAMDEAMRHCITKLSSYHFVSAEKYRKRVIQLGENPCNVYHLGHIEADSINNVKLFNKKELEQKLQLKIEGITTIATYHPVTLENNSSAKQISNLLNALQSFNFQIVFTKSNCDAGGRKINKIIKDFCNINPLKYKFFDNLGQQLYFSCLKYFDFMIGNSSSGIDESPLFKIPVVNIGDRQKGRLKAQNVIDTGYSLEHIKSGIKKVLSKDFKESLKNFINPYEKNNPKNVSYLIKEKLKTVSIKPDILKKEFYEL